MIQPNWFHKCFLLIFLKITITSSGGNVTNADYKLGFFCSDETYFKEQGILNFDKAMPCRNIKKLLVLLYYKLQRSHTV